MSSDIRQLIQWAQSVGWSAERRPGGHWLLRYGTETVTLPATPSDPRALLNARADLERASGIRQPRNPSGHYRQPPRGTGFDMQAALAERRQATADQQRRPVPDGLRQVAAAMHRKDNDQ